MDVSAIYRQHVALVLQDFESLSDPNADPQLEAVKAAILLEDVFGILLSDNDIDPTLLNRAAMEELIIRTKSLT